MAEPSDINNSPVDPGKVTQFTDGPVTASPTASSPVKTPGGEILTSCSIFPAPVGGPSYLSAASPEENAVRYRDLRILARRKHTFNIRPLSLDDDTEYDSDDSLSSIPLEHLHLPSRMNSTNINMEFPLSFAEFCEQTACAEKARQTIIKLREVYRSRMSAALGRLHRGTAPSDKNVADRYMALKDPIMSNAFEAFEERNCSAIYDELTAVASAITSAEEFAQLSAVEIATLTWAVNIVHGDLFDPYGQLPVLSVLVADQGDPESGEDSKKGGEDAEDKTLCHCSCTGFNGESKMATVDKGGSDEKPEIEHGEAEVGGKTE